MDFLHKGYVTPLCLETLADTETPVSLLQKLYDEKGPVFLFESVEGGERWGRYSFIGASERMMISIFPDHIRIRENGVCRTIEHGNAPFPVLRKEMSRFMPAPVEGLPRFWGGLVGYLCYEMVSFFEKIPNHLPKDEPLASFILPDELLVFDNVKNTLLIVSIAFPENGMDPEKEYEKAVSRINERLAITSKPSGIYGKKVFSGENILNPVWSSGRYEEMVRTTKEYIHEGEIIQAVISQPFEASDAPDLLSLYRAQRFINPSPYLFFLHLDDVALVGSSPETMVRLESRVASLRPIAGTRQRGKNEKEDRLLADDLLKDEKERAEHLMLVDLGRNDLGRVAETGSVEVTDLMVVERYSHVMHLVSSIRSDLRPDCDAWDLLQAAFPAGTLSGAPKVRAMEIIAQLEKEPRGPYGGCVGYISFHGNMDMAITIRTAVAAKGKLIVRAGAGIVADSVPETENQETINKAKAISRALQLISRQPADNQGLPENEGE